MEKEVWKDVSGYEGVYQCSNLGRVKLLDGIKLKTRKRKSKILKPTTNHKGYLTNTLFKYDENGRTNKMMKVHRIVAITFLDNPDNLEQINHIDGDKQNNRIDNLEWVTPKQNIRHAIKTGLMVKRKVLSEKEITEIKSLCNSRIGRKPSYEKIAKLYNVADCTIRKVRRNEY